MDTIIKSDGFVGSELDGHQQHFFTHSSQQEEATAVEADATTSEYFQQAEDSTHMSVGTEHQASMVDGAAATLHRGDTLPGASNNMVSTLKANNNYEESGPGEQASEYDQEKLDYNYNYVSQHSFHPAQNLDEERMSPPHRPLSDPASAYTYEEEDERQGPSDTRFYQQSAVQPQGETGGMGQPQGEAGGMGQPNESGAATSYQQPGHIDGALKKWKEDGDKLMDYWAGIFRLSEEYEVRVLEKLQSLLEKAKALEETTQQQREEAVQRVQGIGKILEQ